jgi:anti-sigma regulatory factor (Ser/Thr protein kinase)
VPYVNCPRCGLRTYVAGGSTRREACPACATRLSSPNGRYEYRRNAPTVSMQIDADAIAPATARRGLDPLASRIGEDALDRLQLLISELVSNAVRHAGLTNGDPIALDVYLNGTALYAEVHDRGVGFSPAPPNLDPLRASGWGLWLLDHLTMRWGIDGSAGTTAWFEMGFESAS